MISFGLRRPIAALTLYSQEAPGSQTKQRKRGAARSQPKRRQDARFNPRSPDPVPGCQIQPNNSCYPGSLLVKAEGTWRRRIAPPVTPWANPHSQGGTTRSDRRFRCLVAEQTQRLLRDETRPPYSRGPRGDPPRYPPGEVLIFIRKTNPGRLMFPRTNGHEESILKARPTSSNN